MSIEQRLVDIESKIAYQEDMIQSLDDVVARQQKHIERLEQQNQKLIERIKSLSEGYSEVQNDKPPHY